ncbi:MAG: hypothetical protein JSW62_05885, partial [Thermoplasmatales archaeon]
MGENNFGKPVPIILGGEVNGYGLVRSFGEKNVPTICLDHRKNLALYSKYTDGQICPNPSTKEFIDYLIILGKKINSKGVFYATYD